MKDMVQIRITSSARSIELPEGRFKRGDVVWVPKAAADSYINRMKIAEPIGQGIGPTETKPGEPEEKKASAVEGTAGRSTDSAKSSEVSGTVTQSSASVLAPASRVSNAPSSGRPKKTVKPK